MSSFREKIEHQDFRGAIYERKESIIGLGRDAAVDLHFNSRFLTKSLRLLS